MEVGGVESGRRGSEGWKEGSVEGVKSGSRGSGEWKEGE